MYVDDVLNTALVPVQRDLPDRIRPELKDAPDAGARNGRAGSPGRRKSGRAAAAAKRDG